MQAWWFGKLETWMLLLNVKVIDVSHSLSTSKCGWWEFIVPVSSHGSSYVFIFLDDIVTLMLSCSLSLFLTVYSFPMFVCFICLITDILWPVLCGYQPLQEPAHLFREHHWDVQREEEARDASTHLCHLWVSIPLHASRYDRQLFFSNWPFIFYKATYYHYWSSLTGLWNFHVSQLLSIVWILVFHNAT